MEKRGVDAEKIMQSVRENIAARGVRNEKLSFTDEESAEMGADFTTALSRMEKTKTVCATGDLSGSALRRFCKKIVRKCTRFFVSPVAEDATRFHEATLESVRALEERISALEEELKRK